MDRELASRILESGARVYSSGMMPRFSRWAEDFVSEKYSGLVNFYVSEIGSINSKGAHSRRFWINKEEQEEILHKYFKTLEET